MTTLEKVLERASSAGYQLLAGAINGSGYVLACKSSKQPVGAFQTLEEVISFLTASA